MKRVPYEEFVEAVFAETLAAIQIQSHQGSRVSLFGKGAKNLRDRSKLVKNILKSLSLSISRISKNLIEFAESRESRKKLSEYSNWDNKREERIREKRIVVRCRWMRLAVRLITSEVRGAAWAGRWGIRLLSRCRWYRALAAESSPTRPTERARSAILQSIIQFHYTPSRLITSYSIDFNFISLVSFDSLKNLFSCFEWINY